MADLLVIKEQVDKLGDLQVVDSDLRFVRRRDDQALLLRPVELQVPRRDAVDAAAGEVGVAKICLY